MTQKRKISDEDFVTGAFQALSPLEASAQLSRRVASIPLEHPRSTAGAWWPFGRIWQPTLALFAAAIVGVVSGGAWEQEGASDSAAVAVLEWETEAEDRSEGEIEADSLEGLFALATASDWQDEEWDLSSGEDLLGSEASSSRAETVQ